MVVDDATRRILYAQLSERESTEGVMAALAAVFVRYGLPQSLYTHRASWAACTRGSDGKPRLERPTQVQRALERLGVEHILAYSPQARGRGERVNRTLQGRLVNELRVAGIRTTARANRYLDEVFLPNHNAELTRAPADPASAFVTAGGTDLGQVLCHECRRQSHPRAAAIILLHCARLGVEGPFSTRDTTARETPSRRARAVTLSPLLNRSSRSRSPKVAGGRVAQAAGSDRLQRVSW